MQTNFHGRVMKIIEKFLGREVCPRLVIPHRGRASTQALYHEFPAKTDRSPSTQIGGASGPLTASVRPRDRAT